MGRFGYDEKPDKKEKQNLELYNVGLVIFTERLSFCRFGEEKRMGHQIIEKETETVGTEKEAETARTRRRNAREEAILEAARQLIAESSYNAMTMDDLAARAHISKPTLYQYFPSKEAVAVRAIIGLMRESLAYLENLNDRDSAISRLENFVQWVIAQRFSPFRTAFGVAKTALSPVIRTHPDYLREFARMVSAISVLVEEAKAENDLSRDLSTRIVVQMVFSLLRDSEYDTLVESGECTPHEIVQTLTALFFCGIRQCHVSPLSLPTAERGAAFSAYEPLKTR